MGQFPRGGGEGHGGGGGKVKTEREKTLKRVYLAAEKMRRRLEVFVGAVAAGFLLKGMLDIQTTLMVLGGLVVIAASCVLMIRFSVEHKEKEQRLYEQAVTERHLAEAQQ